MNTREAKTVFASPHGGGQVDLLEAALNAGKENSHCVFNSFSSVSSSEEEILIALISSGLGILMEWAMRTMSLFPVKCRKCGTMTLCKGFESGWECGGGCIGNTICR